MTEDEYAAAHARLVTMRDRGIITEDEFDQAVGRLLADFQAGPVG